MKVHFDAKRKARSTLSDDELRIMEAFASRRGLLAVFSIEEDVNPSRPYLLLRLVKGTSATVPAKVWKSTSFWLELNQLRRFKELCLENEETTCQIIRAFINFYIEMHETKMTRRLLDHSEAECCSCKSSHIPKTLSSSSDDRQLRLLASQGVPTDDQSDHWTKGQIIRVSSQTRTSQQFMCVHQTRPISR